MPGSLGNYLRSRQARGTWRTLRAIYSRDTARLIGVVPLPEVEQGGSPIALVEALRARNPDLRTVLLSATPPAGRFPIPFMPARSSSVVVPD